MICPICQIHEVLSTDPEEVTCIACKRTGKALEFALTNPVRGYVLTKIREMEHVVSADLWPSMPGNFQIGIILTDHRLVETFSAQQVSENSIAAFPSIPPFDGKWLIAITVPQETEQEWSNPPELVPGIFDDEELVEQIAELA